MNDGKCPFYEPEVEDLLNKHLNKTKLLSFSSSISNSVKETDFVFITVGMHFSYHFPLLPLVPQLGSALNALEL